MSKLSRQPLRALVAGGSIGGLCAGLALHRMGATVDIFERSSGAMETRGAGIVAQEELLSFLNRHGAPALPTTSCRVRRYLQPDGGDGQAQFMPQRFTSWEAIYRTLRATFPDAMYHTGESLKGFQNRESGIIVETARSGQTNADLLVCADGAQSETRHRLLPEVLPRYAGYVAWRGTLDESAAPPDLAAFFDDAFTFSNAAGGRHMLAYFIPGVNAVTTKGNRRLNWVWYVQSSDHDLGSVSLESIAELRALARHALHPRMAELVSITEEPFIQRIVDVVVPRTVFGRAALLGDAAFVVRPHTAGATAKAAMDATLLASSLAEDQGNIERALRKFEAAQLRYGLEMVRHGVELGG